MTQSEYKVGDRALVKTTGIEVSISQISEHGFAIVRFECGYERMLLVNQLQACCHQASNSRRTQAA
ncbi:MAG: hypothetical protein OEY11_13750 [Gammaproteobacteria bacterium]|nr:hypothetical protein [Gammaproteobacteria bacterium]